MEPINLMNIIWLLVGGLISLVFLFTLIIILFYKKPTQGQTLIRTGFGGTAVAFSKGIYLIPVLHKLEILDTTIKRIELKLTGKNGLICKDGELIDVIATFHLRANYNEESIKNIVQTLGCEKASNIEDLQEIFSPIFLESLNNVAKKFNFEVLRNSIPEFRDSVVANIGRDLYGFSLEDCSINYMEKLSVTQEINNYTKSFN